MILLSDSPDKTISIGQALGGLLRPGNVVCLSGDLGAGKTHFAKGVALGMGVEEHVTSPTFTIINQYKGRLPLYHVDAYRLENEEEAFAIGLEEYLFGEGVSLIEWAENISDILPEQYLTVSINYSGLGPDTRELKIIPKGADYELLVKELKNRVRSGD